ncbi:hypothetical protein C2E23DRAFT_883869 [Lenzites betulinus]|nr:hypothetical protein C2E23DRAFT_883869 [Lenzites betulinus]
MESLNRLLRVIKVAITVVYSTLANKDNASTLRDVNLDAVTGAASLLLHTEELSPAELRALDTSARGGVKLTGLAGAIFNHKDAKKGQQDAYVFYFREVVGHPLRFPDTSNTRYQSHCAAAAELLVHREEYLRFLEVVRDRKTQPGFNHMEENVYKGLQDLPTLTELAALALYAKAVTHPYMRVVRHHQNGLKLGYLHDQLQQHIQTLIADPDLLLLGDPGESYHKGAMDGKEWERPAVVSAILELVPELPYLRPILVAFLRGALKTWERFSKEFERGGAIDCASQAEIDAAWISPTNDHNEGALGAHGSYLRSHPNATEEYYNAQAKYNFNNTEDFMQAHLHTPPDEKDLHAAGRRIDSSKHESKRRKAQVLYSVSIATQRARHREERQRKENEAKARLAKIHQILDPEVLATLKRDELDDQLEIYRKRENDKEVPLKSKLTTKAGKLEALRDALTRYQAAQMDTHPE